MKARTWWNALVVMGLVLIAAAGCSKKEEAARDAAGPPAAKAGRHTEILAVLARADKVDGTEDQIVSKCPICSLSMDGSPEWSLQVEGYTLHFCSAHCKDMFAADTTKHVLEMRFP